MIELSNHCALHPGCSQKCPDALRINTEMQRALQQATGTMAQDDQALRMKEGIARTEEGEFTSAQKSVDGWETVCHVDGCRSHVSWDEDPQRAADNRDHHIIEHSRQGIEAKVECVRRRGIPE